MIDVQLRSTRFDFPLLAEYADKFLSILKAGSPNSTSQLNPRQLLSLYEYVTTGRKLPESSTIFQEKCPRDVLSKYMTKDPELYNVMLSFPDTSHDGF